MRVTRHRYAIEGWGVGEIWTSEGMLLAHELPGPRRDAASVEGSTRADSGPAPPQGGARPPEVTLAGQPSPEGDALVPDLCRRVARHLAGSQTAYADLPLDLGWCTAFQRSLLQALRAVPWGEVVTYGELAALAGRPRAARAAGSFCAGNRFALVVPCHRVVAADGIGGYGTSGVGLKRRLLRLEGVTL